MTRRILALAMLPLALVADNAPLLGAANTNAVTNVVSNVRTVKGWTRQYVHVLRDGSLIDPSGKLVEAGLEVERKERAGNAQLIMESARDGMTNSLARVYAMTNLVHGGSLSVRLSMKPPVSNTNFYAYVVSEHTDGTNDVAIYYFSRQLSMPPKVQRRYRDGVSSGFVEGEWHNWTTNGVDVTDSDGVTWSGCNELRFTRPSWAVGVPVRPNRHPRLGHPVTGFDFGGAMVFVNGRPTLTGYVTNGTQRAYFDNGVYKGTEEVETE